VNAKVPYQITDVHHCGLSRNVIRSPLSADYVQAGNEMCQFIGHAPEQNGISGDRLPPISKRKAADINKSLPARKLCKKILVKD
jgi:hypothetical protein